MPLPARLLRPGEEIVLDVRPHGWGIVPPASASLVAVVGAVVAGMVGVATWAAWAIVAVIALCLIWLLRRYLRWTTTSFVLTTDRLIHRSGVLGRRSREIPLDQLSDTGYRQGMLGRLVGIGDLTVESAGRDSQEAFTGLAHPADIQLEIHARVQALRDRHAGREVRPSIPEQIDQLADLARRGILTREEFEAKKSELLDRL
jgi:uncharacterized membrane protein YdbT with pleckstrin-like domain